MFGVQAGCCGVLKEIPVTLPQRSQGGFTTGIRRVLYYTRPSLRSKLLALLVKRGTDHGELLDEQLD